MHRQLPIWVVVGVGLLITIEHFLTIPTLTAASREIQTWVVLLSAFLLGIGMINLVVVSVRGLRSKKADVAGTVVMMGGMLGMFVVTAFRERMPAAYGWMFHSVYSPLGVAVFSLLMYAMASAAFRTIRMRSRDSTIFLIAAVAAMLGVAPMGAVVSEHIPAFYHWLLTVPNLAGQRGITIAAAIGTMAASLRVVLGLERRSIGME